MTTLLPTFEWESASISNESVWHFEVATDPAFTQIDQYHSMNLSQDFYTRWGHKVRFDITNLVPGTRYYWRVRLSCNDQSSEYSDAWSFTTSSDETIPAAPRLLSPSDGAVLASLPVTLQWEPVDGATSYFVYFWAPTTGARHVSEPQFTLTWDDPWGRHLAAGTTYRWAVTTVSSYAVSEMSEKWQLTTPQTP